MNRKRPDFDNIKSYQEFEQYRWTRVDLINICKAHNLLYVGSEKKLKGVIESYFNGVKIPPRRNWYTNAELNSFVNENGTMMPFVFSLMAIAVILIAFGIINRGRGTDDPSYVLPLVFGIPVMVFAVIGLQVDKSLAVIRSFFPVCGDKKFTRAQVDEQANMKNAVPLGYEGIILAPDMLIGVSAGVSAVAYEDISSLQVKRTQHSEGRRRYSRHHSEYYTYDIIVRTNKRKKIVISKSRNNAALAAKKLYDHCLKQNPKVKFLIADNQATLDEKSKSNVNFAVKSGDLTGIMVSEDLKKQFARHHLLLRLDSVLGSTLISGILIFLMARLVTSWFSIQVFFFLFIFLAFPSFMVVSFVSAISIVRKNDFDFYLAEISDWYDNGYTIKGLGSTRFGFIKKLRPKTEPSVGDRVILARFDDLYSLLSFESNTAVIDNELCTKK